MIGLGEIRKGKELGKRDAENKYIWVACVLCGKERWVALRVKEHKPRHIICNACRAKAVGRHMRGENHPMWKGGEILHIQGYVLVLKRDHPYCHSDGYIGRARLVLEEKLGRYLLPGMEPHHKNEIKDDDRPENLEELSHSEHRSLHNNLNRQLQFLRPKIK